MGKKKSRSQNTILNLTSGFMGEAIIYLLNFVTRTVFIRTLGRDYLGIGGLFTNILSLLSLADLGVGVALNYRLYKPLKDNDEQRLNSLMTFYKTVYRIIGFGILILGICVIPFLKYLINDYDKFFQLGLNAGVIFLLYLMQSVSTYWFFAYKSAIVKADQKEYYLNIIGYLGALLTAVAQIAILLITHNYIAYIVIVIVLNIVQNYMYAHAANRLYPFLKKKSEQKVSKEETKQIFEDCGAISLFEISSVVLKATDNLVLAAFIGLDIVGLYSNYLMIYNALKKIIKRIIRSAQASIGNLFTEVSVKTKYDFFSTINLAVALLCGTASVCVAVLSDEFITTWIGQEFVIKAPFSLMIALELYTIGLKLNLEQIRDVMGLFQQMKIRPILSVILNIAISIAAVKRLGIYGVLVGTLVSEWLTSMTIDPYIVHKHGFQGEYTVFRYYLKNILYVLELTFIGGLNWLFMKYVLTGYGWISVLAHAVVCGCSTFGFIVLVNYHSKELKTLLSRLTGIFGAILHKKRKKQ